MSEEDEEFGEEPVENQRTLQVLALFEVYVIDKTGPELKVKTNVFAYSAMEAIVAACIKHSGELDYRRTNSYSFSTITIGQAEDI